jgi:hypothetical protein
VITTTESGADGVIEMLQPSPVPNNPCLDYLPVWSGFDDAMDRLTVEPMRLGNGRMESDAVANFPTSVQAHLTRAIAEAMFFSTLERNPADFEYQRLMFNASAVLAETEDCHGHAISTKAISVRNDGARGIFVFMPAEMGQDTLVKAIEDYVGTESKWFYVNTPHRGPIEVNKVKSLTVRFPPNGSPKRFVKTLLHAIDSAAQTGYANETTGPFHRLPDECAFAMCVLCIQHNIGVILVPDITAKALEQTGASVLLGELSQFAKLSGVPLVCIGSTGAASRLVELGATAASLYSKGGVSIAALELDEAQWGLWTEYLWDNYLRFVFNHVMPDWLHKELWKHSCGHTEVATKLVRHIYERRELNAGEELTPELLSSFAEQALKLERAPLRAVAHVRANRPTARDGALRYADWIPLDTSIMAIPAVNESYSGSLLLPLIGEAS